MIERTDEGVRLLYGADVVDGLKLLKDKSVHCVVTSPPYWRARTYGAGAAEIGREETHLQYIERIVGVVEEIKRVLRPDGTLWLNLGDSLQESALCIPHRVGMALVDKGWVLRNTIVWSKTNPMPESAENRGTRSHEYILLLTRKPKGYFYNTWACREEPRVEGEPGRNMRDVWAFDALRDVWAFGFNQMADTGGHVGVFPEELPRRCILLGTSEKGACPACGAPYSPVVDKKHGFDSQGKRWFAAADTAHEGGGGKARRGDRKYQKITSVDVSWKAGCSCDAGDPVPCTVLDPFSGSGTTGKVARELGRHYIGLDLHGDFADNAMRRIFGPEPKLEPEPQENNPVLDLFGGEGGA